MKWFLSLPRYVALAIYILVVVFPIAWMALNSFKTTREIQRKPWDMPKELAERAALLARAATQIEQGLAAMPEEFPATSVESLEASAVLGRLSVQPDSADTPLDAVGALPRIRLLAPEMRETARAISRSQNMSVALREFGESSPERLVVGDRVAYANLRADLKAIQETVASKARAGVFGNYTEAWTTTQIGSAFLNSLIVSFATIVVLIPISAMASYVLAKFRFRGSNALFMLFLGGMMFPQFLVIVPLFLQMSGLGLDDSLFGLTLVYIAFSLPFTVFVLTGFFHQLPDELAEAAMLDGCGHHAVFWKVMWPLAKPGLVVVTIFDVIGLWNEYNLALVLMRTREGFTLPRALDSLQMTAQYLGDTGALMAAMVIVILPVLVVYWLLKDKIHEAMLAGAIKG
ncbi:MAG: carbohydrate ABC transporter permease [Fimbriimonadaceae bacterium]